MRNPWGILHGGAPAASSTGGNGWVRIDPPPQPVTLGIGKDDPDENLSGFRPARKIFSPTAPYEIQRHEVTWGEIDGWMASHSDITFDRPVWVPAQHDANKNLPVAGIPWGIAAFYCTTLGGSLPNEEQWEFAARGAARRPWPWGDTPPDLAQTAIYQSAGSLPHEVGTNPQDKTPGDTPIYDLAGNVQEWTLDYWREDIPNQDESSYRNEKRPQRAVRGLPFVGTAPAAMVVEGAAARMHLCGEGLCVEKFKEDRQYIGFRCIRPAK